MRVYLTKDEIVYWFEADKDQYINVRPYFIKAFIEGLPMEEVTFEKAQKLIGEMKRPVKVVYKKAGENTYFVEVKSDKEAEKLSEFNDEASDNLIRIDYKTACDIVEDVDKKEAEFETANNVAEETPIKNPVKVTKENINKEEVANSEEKSYNKEVELDQLTWVELDQLTWHELRNHAKRLNTESGAKIKLVGARREDILKQIKDLSNGNDTRSSN